MESHQNVSAKSRETTSGLDRCLVDFGTGFVDHHHGAVHAVGIKVEGDLPGDQVGGFLCVALAFAIQPDRILQPDAVGNFKMKNRHCTSPADQCLEAKRFPAGSPDEWANLTLNTPARSRPCAYRNRRSACPCPIRSRSPDRHRAGRPRWWSCARAS